MWRYQVFAQKLTWYFIGVYIINVVINHVIFHLLYYYMINFCHLIGLEQWYFSLIWNTYMWKLQTFLWVVVKTNNSMICTWYLAKTPLVIFQNCLKFHSQLRITISKYHSWYLCQISLLIMLLPIQILRNNTEALVISKSLKFP